ncbi:MAG: membrane lipoprotein lipid attachment site-containing protein [Candidatus Peregrinibacteria bacterium]|nr:membrane lipoprotein lipid attachment site-containing protein [Candidatus Peregrinibacteria bacterium]
MKKYLITASILLLLTGCSEYHSADKEISKKVSQAVKNNDATVCLKLPDVVQDTNARVDGKGTLPTKYPRNECILEYANVTSDEKACDILAEPSYANRGYYLNRKKNLCYERIAEAKSDPRFCENIKMHWVWKSPEICHALATLDLEICLAAENKEYSHLQKSPMTDCIIELVARTKRSDYCEYIKGPGNFYDHETDRAIEYCVKTSSAKEGEYIFLD